VGTRASVGAVADIFEAGARAKSDSTFLHDARDGDIGACRGAAAPNRPAPGCGAPLRIEVQRIDPRSEARATCELNGKPEDCARWSNEVFDRDIDDSQVPALMTKLLALCRAGERGACGRVRMNAGLYERARKRSLNVDHVWVTQRACELGEESCCIDVAERLEAEGHLDEAFRMREHACASGNVSCGSLADLVENGQGPTNAGQRRQYRADLRARACVTSSTAECAKYAVLFRAGLRARGDFHRVQVIVHQCEKDGFLCSVAAASYAFGIGVPRDLARARQLYARECARPVVQDNLRGRSCELPKEWR
jgi:putative intracellular protease/amidase